MASRRPGGAEHDYEMLSKIESDYMKRDKEKADAGDRPDYSGPGMSQDKVRFKDAEARRQREERKVKHEEEQRLWAEKQQR